jgi:hypothetical protein
VPKILEASSFGVNKVQDTGKGLFLPFAANRAIAPAQTGEESLDSKEQCTGEEPAGPELVEGSGDSATENYRPLVG